jgi:hypothetical protein
MLPPSQIRADQIRPGGGDLGTPGVSRSDLWLDWRVDLFSTGMGSGPTWALITQPSGSTAILVDAGMGAAYFVPDLPGEYGVQLDVNDGGSTSTIGLVVTFDYYGTPITGPYPPSPTPVVPGRPPIPISGYDDVDVVVPAGEWRIYWSNTRNELVLKNGAGDVYPFVMNS